MSDEEILKLWRELPSDYKQFDELVLAFARKLKVQKPTDDQVIDAAQEHAALYDGDDRQDIKTDVMNAFYAGVTFAATARPEVPEFIVRRVETAIEAATNPKGMHTNGPAYACVEASTLSALLRYARGG